MSFYIQDFCCTCLSTSNEKCSEDSSKYTDNLSPFDKIKTVFLGFSAVMDSDCRICKKCSDIIDRTYEFHKTSLKNINVLNSYKKVLKENKLIKQCDLFDSLNESKQFKENTLPLKEVKIEPPKSPLNKDDMLCNTDFASECHSSGAVKVKEELEMNETCDEESEISRLYPEVKIEIGEINLKKEWMSEIEKTSEDVSLKTNVNDFENISVELTEEVFVKEEILEDPLLEVPEGNSPEKRGHCESIGENPSKFLQEEPIHADKELFDCAECGESLSCKSELDAHMLIHSKKQTNTRKKSHKCDVCGKLFNRNGSLKIHMMVHTGEKPHKCDICEKLFIQNAHLKTHMLIHTGEKPHKCDICGKFFTQKNDLKRHTLTHTGEKSHKCNICGRLFTIKTSLETHMLIHTGEKRHNCDICGKFFTQRATLNKHMLTHTGEKSHKCDVCEKLFTLKSSLERHMLIHTGVKPFECNFCGKSFNQRGSLNSHMLLHSGENRTYVENFLPKKLT